MINIEVVLENLLDKCINVLRGRLAAEQSIPITIESLFLELYSQNSKQFRKGILSNKVYEVLEEDEILKGVLSDVFILREKDYNKLFKSVMECFDNEEFKTILKKYKKSYIFSLAIDQLYKNSRFLYKTPENINKLIARVVENKKIQSLYDPAIGTGSLTIEIAKTHKNIKIYGQEIYPRSLNICKMIFILDGRSDDIKNIHLGNTLTNPMHVENNKLNKFDCVVSDIPMALKDWGYNEGMNDKYKRFKRGMPAKNNGEYAFISHMVESLDENGFGVVLVTSGVLFRGGAERTIREKLIEENLVECVIALPNNMMHNTSIPVNLLILNKNKKSDQILFIDVAKNTEPSRTLTTLSDEMIDKIGSAYEGRMEVQGFSKLVSFNVVESNEFNLNINRYMMEIEDEKLDINAINDEVLKLEKQLKDIQDKIRMFI
ncbi:type I restriction system adenine methylase HsdM [[Clostridium] sordellii]|uniref:N-6 DNA methylase n=1 Tax=Paraclostridium sordellii TaxID=1505 RepID=UPI0005E34230|nr:N-6 DNA methylase [Paeniclostridium sordellii]CEP90229.1 type I restriction system adenine methylase HsdM [[Clostridium] sordellii] [Paeniclostridium sordellii]